MDGLTTGYIALAVVFIISVAIPMLKSAHWTVRVFDYPRSQKMAVGVALSVGWVLLPLRDAPSFLLLAGLLAGTAFLGYVVFPYTPFGTKMIQEERPRPGEKPHTLMVCNVLQTNHSYHRLAALITERRPEVVFLLETDDAWRH